MRDIIYKRVWAVWMVMTMVMLSVVVTTEAEITTQNTDAESGKLSEELRGLLENGGQETLTVTIWMDEVEKEDLWNEAERQAGVSIKELELKERQLYGDELQSMENDKNLQDRLAEISAEVDEIIRQERALYVENNLKRTLDVLSEVGVQHTVFVSQYAPMVICEVDLETLQLLLDNDSVNAIDVYRDETAVFIENESNNVMASEEVVNTSFKQAMGINTVSNMGYTGLGVNVGMVDAITLTPLTHAEFAGSNVTPAGGSSTHSNRADHAINMGRIICGTYGVAPQCHLYTYGRGNDETDLTIMTGVETLLNQNVSVINASIGDHEERNELGSYCNFEKWIDHIAYQHNVTFVVGAGNVMSGDVKITVPGGAYNAITVANYDHVANVIHNTSCYDYETGCVKPDVAATGARVLMYYSNGEGGTSSATACTTGIVALLMQAKPTLKAQPQAVKAIVLAGCDRIGTITSPNAYYPKQGAGVANAYRSLRIIQLNQYYTTSSAANGTYSITRNIAHERNSVTVALAAIKRSVSNTLPHNNYGNDPDLRTSTVAMPYISLLLKKSNGSIIYGSNMANSSTEISRCSYESALIISTTISNMDLGPCPWSVAWY